jgi:hypothetical protein
MFGDRLDVVAGALDAAVRAAGVYPMCTGAAVLDFTSPLGGSNRL